MISIESATTPHSFNFLLFHHLQPLLILLLPSQQNHRIVNFNAFIISILKITVCAAQLFFSGKGPSWGPTMFVPLDYLFDVEWGPKGYPENQIIFSGSIQYNMEAELKITLWGKSMDLSRISRFPQNPRIINFNAFIIYILEIRPARLFLRWRGPQPGPLRHGAQISDPMDWGPNRKKIYIFSHWWGSQLGNGYLWKSMRF